MNLHKKISIICIILLAASSPVSAANYLAPAGSAETTASDIEQNLTISDVMVRISVNLSSLSVLLGSLYTSRNISHIPGNSLNNQQL